MPSRRAATPPLPEGATSRRHAELLLGLTPRRASVRDLRLRRVFSPASVAPDASPDRLPAKAAAAAERRPVLAPCSRSKLVRDRNSFGYRRMLPFLAEMAREDGAKNSPCKNDPTNAGGFVNAQPTKICDFTENLEAMDLAPADSISCEVQQVAVLEQQIAPEVSEEFARYDSKVANGVVEEFVEGSRGQAAPVGAVESAVRTGDQEMKDCCNDVKEEARRDSGNHMAEDLEGLDRSNSKAANGGADDSVEGCRGKAVSGSAVEIGDEEMKDCCNDVNEGGRLHYGDLPESKPRIAQCSRSRLVRHPSSLGYKRLLPYLMEIARDEVSSQGGNTAKVERTAEEKPLTPNVTNELLSPQLQESSDLAEVHPCQSSESEHSEVDLGSPTEVTPPLTPQDAQEPQTSMARTEASAADPLLDIGMFSRPSDPCTIREPLSMLEMAGCAPGTELGPRKTGLAGALLARGTRASDSRVLSPKKGILKRHTTARACKGVCMCLDCCTYRLHADRAFEFSRKQMQEADDMIGFLLEELGSLRHVMERFNFAVPLAGNDDSDALQQNQELMQAARKRATCIEEVANARRQQMFLDLNCHCRIPGPRVRFAERIQEKVSSPKNTNCR